MLRRRSTGIVLNNGSCDKMQWLWRADKEFSVKSACSKWKGVLQQNSHLLARFGGTCIPLRLNSLSGKLPEIGLQLCTSSSVRREVMARDGSGLGLCVLYVQQELMETTDHLFSHCTFAGNVMVY
ncbi:hypothetical protein RHMOL_Rhmol07G0305400 [Rhododendron molle]|uniref:Uncharacterized protein n=1 Tax=Rhododendron molle TaxID=49168 RepID=A0ACC0N6E5_RHOML|nr:hypothetical protein RHMOL_Rhmol07G0305400 [Rhododendron molle]